MDPYSEWLEYHMADSKHNDGERQGAEEQAEDEAAEPADSGEKVPEDRSDPTQRPRRIPGLHGYDPNQWPDASV
jgi:hypothetical protein